MKKMWLFLCALCCTMALEAQELKIDKDLKALVDGVVSLKKGGNAQRKAFETTLSNSKKWRLMYELKDQNGGECFLSNKIKNFNLNPIINGVLTRRHGKSEVPGCYLGGEDARFDYSLIEKGIKAKKKVKYTFQDRVGKQDFIIIACDSATILSIKFSKGSSSLKAVQRQGKDGCIYLHINTKLKSKDKITMEIENRSNDNVAIAILSHNTRK